MSSSMHDTPREIAAFKDNVEAILSVLDFDRPVIDFVIAAVREREERLRNAGVRLPAQFGADRLVQHLGNVRENESLRQGFGVLNNQSVVLLVSHFGWALSNLFRSVFDLRVDTGLPENVLKDEYKLSLEYMTEIGWDIKGHLADLILNRQGVNFQNMKSVSRTFEKYLGYCVPSGETTNDIVVAQACRHAIVHSAGRVENALARQIEYAEPRNLKLTLEIDQVVVFEPAEVRLVARAMTDYLDDLQAGVRSVLL